MTSVAELLPRTKKLAFELQSQVRQVGVRACVRLLPRRVGGGGRVGRGDRLILYT
jgi:hypothetical protein